jgi:hypothetical protein
VKRLVGRAFRANLPGIRDSTRAGALPSPKPAFPVHGEPGGMAA